MNAYKELVTFLCHQPVIAGGLALLCIGVSVVPFAAFPLKMAAFALLICLSVAVVTTQYRTGSLKGLLKELAFQQKIILSVMLGVTILSWAGYAAAGIVLEFEVIQLASAGDTTSAGESMNGVAVGGIIMAASAICVSQILPLVLTYFCHGLGLSRQQGEQIWQRLLLNHKSFLAFMPVAQFVPAGIFFNIDCSAPFLLAGALYSTFIFFIIFNIQPSAPQRSQALDLVGQH